MKRSMASHRQRLARTARAAIRRSRPYSSVTITSGGGGLLPMLKLFALVCVLSLMLTMVLFYLVTHRPDTIAQIANITGVEPPLPVDDSAPVRSEHKRSEETKAEVQLKPLATPVPGPVQGVDNMESIMLSKMLEGRPGALPKVQKSVTMKPTLAPPPKALHDTPFNKPKPPAVKSESKAPAPVAMPPSLKHDAKEPSKSPSAPKPVTPAPSKSKSKDPPALGPSSAKKDSSKESKINSAAKSITPPPADKQVKKDTPHASHSATKPPPAPTPKPPPAPTPAPPPPTPAPSASHHNNPRKAGPPGLPVVAHDPHAKPVKVQTGIPERASLQDIENFIFSTTPIVKFSLDISEDMIENFEVTLPKLIPNLRAPCWLEEVPVGFTYEDSSYRCHVNTRKISKGFDFMESVLLHRQMQGKRWRIRCMPAFFLIGVLKSGTTDMFEALSRHPNVMQPEIKEPEYWSRNRFDISPWLFKRDCLKPSKAALEYREYLDIYDKPSEAIRLSMLKRSDGSLFSDMIFGDYSTHTFVELIGWDKTLDAPRYVSAHHIHQMAPNTKFILMLRDPVERAYSRYKMRFVRRQNVQGTAAEFHLRMLREVKDTLECMKTNSRRFCVYKENFGREGYHTMLVHGLYIVYLSDWLSIVPREQLYVVRFEDYIQDRVEYVEDIAYFLGLGPIPESAKKDIERMAVPNPSTNIGDMMNETRSLMREFYKPFNHELSDVLHDTRFRWGY